MKREWLIGRFIVPTALFLSMIAVGATIYTKLEGWSVIDAVYFSVATATTLGYGDVVPVTVPGKIFTIIFAFLTIGSVSYTHLTLPTSG